LSIYSWLWDNA